MGRESNMAIASLAILVTLMFASQADSQQQSASEESKSSLSTFQDYLRARRTQLKENIRKKAEADLEDSNSALSTSQDALRALDMKIKALEAKLDKRSKKDTNSTLSTSHEALRALEMKIEALEAKMDKENGAANDCALKSAVETDLQTMNTTIGAVKSTVDILQKMMKTMESKIGGTARNESFVALEATVEAQERKINAIEAMSGRLVYFRATFKLDHFWTTPKVAVFDILLENTGKAYNPSSGIFKAPFQGLYVFTVQLLTPGGQNVKLDLRVNSISVMLSRAVSVKEASTVFVHGTSLQAGDEVYVYHTVACEIFGRMSSFFSGWLVKSY
ncbi:uncharacterized protein LOC112575720 isoform X2 [Pomacea canaliculata]|uniref:uncharacterized protein LOC112575720 isoform X2 n=1 Tax=Pomacea canaliculata TaxID=400727 RepID=UPI000D739543|nr:uncharacterized protein LOC112575720 isoform X2 [Pomacea canaliculata]